MKKPTAIAAVLLIAALALSGCAGTGSGGPWVTLIDGEKGLENWNRIGDANWRAEGGAIVADKGKVNSYLVTKRSYSNFQIRAEFWADSNTNSGIFIRMADPNKPSSVTGYEVNIYDQRPDPSYGTGAIVGVYKVVPMPKAGGKWNTFEITANDTHLRVKLNGIETVTAYDSKSLNGPFALQWGTLPKGATPGSIKWRKVEVRDL